jgi:antitoxin (DNA-binding transcriptional repressor) of toxin-antitoxin stability system
VAIIAISEEEMRSVNVAKLKDQLSRYLAFARSGEEIVIRDRNLPVAKLVPLSADEADDQELKLVAEGKMRLPQKKLDIKQFSKISSGAVSGNKAIEALLAERDEAS